MSKCNRNRTRKAARQDEQRPSRNVAHSRKRTLLVVLGLVVSSVAVVVLGFAFTGILPTELSSVRASQAVRILSDSNNSIKPPSLKELLALPETELAKVDLAVMNLLCAEGLPGAKLLDVMECSTVLDKWAEVVRFETERHLYKFRQAPQEYENSEGFFRMLMLNTVLQQDFGAHYNLERMREIDFSNSKDLFIHGMINDDNGGTCASMPVLVTAVARRLGYPVRLSTAKAHVFCRWESPGDRINLEPSGKGMNTYPDEYYKTWPLTTTEVEIRANRYPTSLTPNEELANFLENRGHCLVDNNRFDEAEAVFAKALALCPDKDRYKVFMTDTQNERQIMANGGWQRIDPNAPRESVSGIMDTWEHNRRMRRYSSKNPIPNSDPYSHVQPGASNQFANPPIGVPQQLDQNMP